MADLRNGSVAARRSADVLLRGVGGRSVLLRVPGAADIGDVREQIGLTTPNFQDVELAPAVFRKLRGQVKDGAGTRWELLLSAISVERVVGILDAASASSLFASASGVVVSGTVMEIEASTASDVCGMPCVYRLVLREPIANEL